ncbi:parathyroid hormone/parathyroid hormone-related peptide receptor [Leptinotarsa decemlineata]|uniref:parathyroid hormone/parathyroid hormone-related peptide receptor n=1 Tax=Leptinotarsa decemlineata TaxID=7539 RepID=UPI000C253B13|nr:parathyroid hormone/parathyroid hormone-related peptide receptor-like [Leptinotarsa decemlineata]
MTAKFENENDVLDYLRNVCFESTGASEKQEKMCPTYFDGYLCWPATKAGETAIQPCSGELLKSTDGGSASIQCTQNGTWMAREDSDLPFTNFSGCGSFFTVSATEGAIPQINSLYMEWVPRIKLTSCVGYTISVTSLVISIYIFFTIKRLRCSRNTLHINLFFSFIMRSFMSIMKDVFFVKGTALACDTVFDKGGNASFPKNVIYSWVCKAIVSLRFYFIIVNFMFMLMEGMYLHNLMFLKLFSDNHSVAIYCLMGWGLPILFLIPWIILRAIFDNVRCWTEKSNLYIDLLVALPIGITIVMNFILFLIIVRVLTVKLNNVCIQQRKYKYRKLLKATLILIPLFGVPYVFTLSMSLFVKRERDPVLMIFFLFVDQSFAAFQGFFAALLYCLLNSEVQVEILRKYSSLKDRHDKEFRRSRTISNTQQFSMPADDFPDNSETLHELTSGKKINPEGIELNKDRQGYF